MSKNVITTAIAIAVLLLGIILVARGRGNQSEPATASGKLTAAEKTYNFGKISMAAGTVRHSFAVKNESGAAVKIKKIFTSCMCTQATLKLGEKTVGPYGMPGHGLAPSVNEEIAAGGEALVEVVFDPAAHGPAGVGRVSRQVTVETDDGAVTLSFAAEVTP